MLDPHVRQELVQVLGQKYVMDRPDELLAYSYDATPLYQSLPDVAVQPATTAEVAAVVQLCVRECLPLYTRGSGTNLCAGTVPIKGGVVMALNRMNQILELDKDNLTATVQAGVVTANLHKTVEAMGLFYPPDPGSMRISTIGGNIGTNAGGLRGLKYGVTSDYVMGLQAVLPNGQILQTGGKNTKDVAGYNLTQLLIGSEGTLGVITEATLKLLPLPEARRTALALFDDMVDAGRAVSRIIAERIIPGTLEFLDQGTLQAVEAHAKLGLPTDVAAVLLLEQDGPVEVCQRDIEAMARICREEGAREVQVAATPEEGVQLMAARRTALSALARRRPTTVLEDATVPRAQVAAMVKEIQKIAKRYDVEICTFGHAGDGNLHPTCMTDSRNHEEMERVEKAFDDIFAAALDLGGTITGEHGVGMAKAQYLEWRVGTTGLHLMRGIKQVFDPDNILNPGKLFGKPTRKRVVVQK